MTITLEHYLIVSLMLMSIGIVGALTRRNMLVILMSIELMLAAATLSLVAFARWKVAPWGQAMALIVLALAAAVAALGLGIILAAYRNRHSLMADDYRLMKG